MALAALTLLSYLAGIIDADGTIGIKRSTYAMRHRNGGQPTYSECLCVKQVRPEAVALLHKTFRGCRYGQKSYSEKGRPLHVWQITDLQAAQCLELLWPYLRLKRKQAGVCLRLRAWKIKSKKERNAFGRGHVGGAKRPLRISKAMENCYLKIKELNRVGV